jgi:hypothetical protein
LFFNFLLSKLSLFLIKYLKYINLGAKLPPAYLYQMFSEEAVKRLCGNLMSIGKIIFIEFSLYLLSLITELTIAFSKSTY